MLKHRRLLIAILVVVALLSVALWPSAIDVDVARVSRGSLMVTVDEEGETRVRERYVVSAPIQGELLRIEFEPGDAVEAGRPVAILRPVNPGLLDARTRAEASAAVRTAEAALARSRAESAAAASRRDRAGQQVARLRDLAAQRVVSADELEAVEAEARVAEESLRAAESAVIEARAAVDAARARLIQGTTPGSAREVAITAPVTGVVLKQYRESRTVVPAGDPLLEIGDPNQLEIVADLLSADAVKVMPGADVLVEQWGGNETLHARVRRVEPSAFLKVSALGVEEQRVNVIMDFADAATAWRTLGDGYRVEVRIVIWKGDGLWKVPLGSLFRRGDGWAIFAVEDGRARLREVTVGQRNPAEAQVTDGIAEGAVVVLYPPDTLTDGARVNVRSQ
jgi:HlyD family secretion protein